MTPQVILLAAGKSSRTWPIEEKTLFRFLGKTVLEHQINTLLAAGLTDICVVGNKQNITHFQAVCAEIPAGKFDFAIQDNLDEGIRGGILAAEKIIDKHKPLLVVCSNDMVEKSAYENILTAAKKSSSFIFLVGKIVENYFPGGYLCISSQTPNRIDAILEKPGAGNEPSNLVTILVHLYKNPASLLEALHKVIQGDNYEETLQYLFDSGEAAEAVKYTGFWQAIKYPWHLLALQDYFLQSLTPHVDSTAVISPKSSINGNVVIEEGVKIMDFAVINGPVYIGKNTIVANHALVRTANVEANCVIGHTTEIARSVLQPHCWTHQNFIGDSIFDENVSLGAGARTANLRLNEQNIFTKIKDEKINSGQSKFGSVIGKNVRVGINASLMPGIKIGKETFLGAGGVYTQDVAENQFVYLQQEYITLLNKENASIRK